MELLALEWTDVDLRAHQLVSFSKSRSDGFTTNGTKSGKPRKVPLSPTLAAALKAHRHMRGPLVFCQDDGTPLTLWHLHGALERAARRASLRLLRWHDLRHSFASNLTIGGTPMRQVQEWMGHSTILMTMTIHATNANVLGSALAIVLGEVATSGASEPEDEPVASAEDEDDEPGSPGNPALAGHERPHRRGGSF